MFFLVAISELFLDPVTDMQKTFFLFCTHVLCNWRLNMPTTSQSVLFRQIGCAIFIPKLCFLLGVTRQNCWSNIQISLFSFYWKKFTHIYSTIDKHNFSMGHHILLSSTFQYRHRICWACCNPLIFSAKTAGSNHGTGIYNTLCLLFIT